MSIDFLRPRHNEDRFLFWPLFVAAALFVLLLIPSELISIWRNQVTGSLVDLRGLDLSFLAATVFVVLFFFFRSFTEMRTRRFKRSLSYFVCAAALSASLFFVRPALFWLQKVKLTVFPDIYRTCRMTAHRYSESNAFKVCSIRVHRNAYMIIAYDSGGEIGLPPNLQSDSIKTLISLQASPVFTSCYQHVTRIVGHFYYVEADCG